MKLYLVILIAAIISCMLLPCLDKLGTRGSALVLEVRRIGTSETAIFVEGRRREANELVAAINARLTRVPTYVDDLGTHPDIEVIITGNSEIKFGAFRPVLEACRECGIHLVTLASGDKEAPLLLFYPIHLRRGTDLALTIDPPRVKLLRAEKNSRKLTDSPEGRLVLKVGSIWFPQKKEGQENVPDYSRLAEYFRRVQECFWPFGVVPFMLSEIYVHETVPFGEVVQCASAIQEYGIVEVYMWQLPFRFDDLYDDLFSDTENEKYEKQVARIRRECVGGEPQWYDIYRDEETGHALIADDSYKEKTFGCAVGYLRSRDVRRRALGQQMLRSYFGTNFGYSAWSSHAERSEAIRKANLWWEKNKPHLVFDETDEKFIRREKPLPESHESVLER